MGYGNKEPKVIKIEAGGTDPALRQDVDSLNLKLNENTAQLAQIPQQSYITDKATKTELSAVASGSPKGVYTTLSALQTVFPTGNSNIYLVTADGKWYYWNGIAWAAGGTYQSTGLTDSIVTPPKLNGEIVSPTNRNLYNKYTSKSKTFLTDGVTETANVNMTASDFIPVEAKKAYIVTQVRGTSIFFYDSSKTVIGNITVGSEVVLNYKFITPANTAYLRANVYTGYEESYMLIAGSEMPGSFIPHYALNENMVNIKDKSIGISKLSTEIVDEGKINTYNKKTTIKGYVLNSSTGELNANASYSASDFIPVEPSTKYIVTALRGIGAFHYDANKVLVGTNNAGATTVEGFTFTTPATAVYTRLNIYTGYEEEFMMVKGESLPLKFIPFYKLSPLLPVHFKDIIGSPVTNKLEGKTLYTYGDSITWYDGKAFQSTHLNSGEIAVGYQSYIRNDIGMNVVNKGVSGNRLRQIIDDLLLQDFSNVDYVSITSGANDWSQNYPLGTLATPKSAFVYSSFYGALQQGVEHVLTNYPNTKIILVTPVRGYHPVSEHPAPNPQGVIVDTMMEQPEVFAKAFKDVAKLYGLPIIDFRDGIQLNFINYQSLLGDDPLQTSGKYVHPNNACYELMGNYIVGELKRMM